MDDYSRYLLERTGVTQGKMEHRPRLLSDSAPGYVSNALRRYLNRCQIRHVRGAPYQRMAQGKIERYHRSLENVVKLDDFHFPSELETAIAGSVDYYNHHRYHKALNNLTPADVCHGRAEEARSRREEVKQETLQERRRHNLHKAFHSV